MLLPFFNFLAVVSVMPFCIKLKNNLASSVHNHHKSPCTFLIQLCSKKPNADWRDGQRKVQSSTKANAAACTWGGTTPVTSRGWGPTCGKAALWRRIWEPWGTARWPWASCVSLWPSRPVVSWGALGGALPAGRGRWPCPFTHPWWGYILLCPLLGSSVEEGCGACWAGPVESYRDDEETEASLS